MNLNRRNYSGRFWRSENGKGKDRKVWFSDLRKWDQRGCQFEE
jgi:hypothetical protein